MDSLNLTGHYILDAGIAASAGLLEEYDGRVIPGPEQMSGPDILRALELAQAHFYYCPISKCAGGDKRPLFYFLLQEVLPGSPWDQVKCGEVADGMRRKFEEYVSATQNAIKKPALSRCFISGEGGHLAVSKSHLPMLASAGERPNCYPNLSDGLMLNGYLAIAVLLAPFGIEKTVNDRGKGGQNIVYHSTEWRLMVQVARQTIDRTRRMVASGAIETFHAKDCPKFQRGTWRKALQTLIRTSRKIPPDTQPQVVIWSFNASNQTCRYEYREASDAFWIIAAQGYLQPMWYRELLRIPDQVAQLILHGDPIITTSLVLDKSQLDVRPMWPFQRFYAEQVLQMSPTLLNAIEDAATSLSKNAAAYSYCLHEASRPDVLVLAEEYGLAPETVAKLASAPCEWSDYLKAAMVWAGKGNAFALRNDKPVKPEEIERVLVEVAPQLSRIGSYGAAARLLNTPSPHRYGRFANPYHLVHGGLEEIERVLPR